MTSWESNTPTWLAGVGRHTLVDAPTPGAGGVFTSDTPACVSALVMPCGLMGWLPAYMPEPPPCTYRGSDNDQAKPCHAQIVTQSCMCTDVNMPTWLAGVGGRMRKAAPPPCVGWAPTSHILASSISCRSALVMPCGLPGWLPAYMPEPPPCTYRGSKSQPCHAGIVTESQM